MFGIAALSPIRRKMPDLVPKNLTLVSQSRTFQTIFASNQARVLSALHGADDLS